MCSPGLRMLAATDRHGEVAGEVIGELPHLAGNLMHDAETAILMREHGVRRHSMPLSASLELCVNGGCDTVKITSVIT